MSISNNFAAGGGGCIPTLPKPFPDKTFPKPSSGGCFPVPGTAPRQAAQQQGEQLERIKQCLADGSLSEQEAARLLSQQAKLADLVSRSEADGSVSVAERRAIQQALNQANGDIFQARHNSEQGNPWADPLATMHQLNQVSRIKQGVQSGSLSANETAGLLREQSQIASLIASTQQDGWADPFAQFAVEWMQQNASRNIYNEKHDSEQASWKRPPSLPVVY